MNGVFLDTVGLLALWNRSDQWHGSAEAAFQGLLNRRSPLFTTSFVLLECGNAAARYPFRQQVCDLRTVLRTRGELIEPSDTEVDLAWVAFERGDAGQAGIVDHISFAVMRRLGIRDAFTNDRHYRAAGLNPLF
jgi:predicted nucleic acid-binding protein